MYGLAFTLAAPAIISSSFKRFSKNMLNKINFQQVHITERHHLRLGLCHMLRDLLSMQVSPTQRAGHEKLNQTVLEITHHICNFLHKVLVFLFFFLNTFTNTYNTYR